MKKVLLALFLSSIFGMAACQPAPQDTPQQQPAVPGEGEPGVAPSTGTTGAQPGTGR